MSSSTNSSVQPRASRESKRPEIVVHRLEAREPFPNNARLPALLYRGVLRLVAVSKAAASIEKTFTRNGWKSGWRDGVYNYHH